MKPFLDSLSRNPRVVAVFIAMLALAIDFSGLAQRLELAVADVNMSLVPQNAPENIAIVAVDEKSLREYGRWPWSRQMHARLLERLRGAGSGPVVFDVLFADENQDDPAGDQAFAAAVARHGKVVLAMISDEDPDDGMVSEVLPFSALARVAAGIGHADMAVDNDGIVRSAYLLAGTGVARWPGLALAALTISGESKLGGLPGENFSDRLRYRTGRWVRDHKMLFPFTAEPGKIPVYSFTDVLEAVVPNDELQGKTLFVGVTADAVRREFATPQIFAGAITGVEIHANVLHALQQQQIVTRVQGIPRILGLLLLSLLAAGIVAGRSRIRSGLIRLALAVVVSGGVVLAMLLGTGLIFPLTPVWLSAMIGSYLLFRRPVGHLQKLATGNSFTSL
ncbi:CHASE2 domain-containing protein [Thiolapillus sp.]